MQLGSKLDDVVAAHNEFDVVQSLPDSPTSASAMLTFADIVAASTVKTWNDCEDRGRCSSDSSSSSDGSTVTATTVRTVVNKSNVRESAADLAVDLSTKKPHTTKSTPPRSSSRPASVRVHQLSAAAVVSSSRSRSVSQPRQTTSPSASNSYVPRNVKSRSPRLNKQYKH